MADNVLKHMYDKLPGGITKHLCKIPFSLRAGRSYRATVKLLNETQWLSRAELNKYQFKKLKEALIYAYGKAPYYRDLFLRISFDPVKFNNYSEFEKIPLLSKKDVFDYYQKLRSTDFNSFNSYAGLTGGTTGQPLKLLFSLESYFIEWAFMHTQWKRVGFTPQCRRIALLGVPFKKDKTATWKYNPLHNELQISPLHLDEENLCEYVNLIKEFKPQFLYGYPSALTVFAAYLIDYDVEINDISAVLCASESLSEMQRSSLKDAFNARIYAWYGQTEKVVLGGECEKSPDYHLFSEYGYTELVDGGGNVIKEPGEPGEIVGTGFTNMAMPLIRYRTDDFGEYCEGECSCGARYLRLKKVVGRRNNQYLVTVDNSKMPFTSIDAQKTVFGNVYQWQFVQRIPGKVEVDIISNSKITPSDIRAIELELNSQVENKINFKVSVVQDVIRTERGKIKGFIQAINMQ